MLGLVAHGRRNLTSRIVFQTIGSTGFHNGLIGNIGNRNFPKLTLRHKHVATEDTANGETTKLTIADFRYRDGNTFRGWWLVGKERRQGVLTYPDGKTLTGEFHGSRLINGEGHIRREDGGFYEGGVKNGLKHGKGRLVSQYEALEGEFRNNKIFNGEGALTTREGIKYEGVWAEGQFTGKRTCPAGYVLEGEFRDSAIYNGSGTIAYADGETFTGTWKAGKKHGPGVRIKADFMVVECYFKDNAATGWGKITYPDGNVYEGDLYQNQKHGDGTITNSDGSILKGEFKDDRIYNGSGTLKLPYGAQVGTWVEGKREGQGKTIFNRGGVWEGEFKDNKMHNGQGVMHWASGNTYEGSWVDGKMDGKGRFTSTEGHIWQGEFKDGKMYTGESLMKGPTGLELYATWKDGFSYSDRYDATIEERMGRNKEEEEKLHQTLLALREESLIEEEDYLDKVMTCVESEPSLAPSLEVTHLDSVETTALSVGDPPVVSTAPSLENSEPQKQVKLSSLSAEAEEKLQIASIQATATSVPATTAAALRIAYYPDGRIGEFQPMYKDGTTFEVGKITHPDGRTLEGEFKEGKIWNVQGVFKFRDGNVYEGTFKESKMHGQGKFTYPDGRSHEGEFKKGKLWNGTGVITLKDGNVYEGVVAKGKRHGQGKIIYPDGRVLEGEFRVGLFYAGKGYIYNKDGSVYEGSVMHGRRHGAGSLSNADGSKWEGRWEDGVFVEGKVVQSDGSTQEGEWVNEKLVKGVTCPEKGVMSEGTYTADGVLLNGLQQFVCNEGTVRQIVIVDGVEISRVDIPLEAANTFFSPLVSAAPLVKNTKAAKEYKSVREKRQANLERQKVFQEQAAGAKSIPDPILEPVAATIATGPKAENTLPLMTVVPEVATPAGVRETRVVHYPNGNTYSGKLKEGKMHGQGKLIYPNGRTLEGEFREDRLWNGKGVLTHKDGAVYEGEFKKRKKHGQGKLTHPDGRTSEGEFKEGKIWNGTGVLTLEGNVYEGQFLKGKLHGQGTVTYPDGRIQEGQWEAGVLVDNSNQQLVKEARPKNNKKKQVPLVTVAVAEVVPPVSTVPLTPEAVTKYNKVRAERLAKMMKQRQLLAQEAVATVAVEKITVRPEESPAVVRELTPAALLKARPEVKILQELAPPATATIFSSSLPPAIKTTSKPNKPSKPSTSRAANAPSKVPSTSESKKHVTSRTHTSYYPNGNVYEGELKNNQWHGQGKLTYPDGRTLEGKFKNGDLVSGVGVLILSNGDIYGGEFQQGKIWNGAGVYTHVKSGDVYEGEYLNGKKHGQGQWNFVDGRTWQGEFKEGMLWNGTGVWHLRRGSVYEGEVREGKRHGQGKLSHADGTGKEGRWEAGELVEEKRPVSALPEIPASALPLTAEAVTKYNTLRAQRLIKLERQQALIQEAAAAAIAKAESEPATVEVTEEQVATSSEVYPTSAPTIRSADVNSIEPEDNPLPEAPSEGVAAAPVPSAPLTSAADQKYNALRAERLAKIERQQLRAQVASEQPMSVPKARPEAELTQKESTTWNGKGVLTLKDGSVYEGKLSEGKRHGQGKITYPDGRSLEGEFRNGFIVSGTGVLCLTNGNMYGGEFKKSKLWNGVAILSLLEGKVFEGEYREGKHHGDARVVYPDGRALEGVFPSDRLTSGSGVIRSADGSVYEGEVIEGRRHGQGKLILHNGGVWEGRWENDAFFKGTKVNAIGQVQEIE